MSSNTGQACKILLRHDQKSSDVGAHLNPNVTICAPSWVREGLQILAQHLQGYKFQVTTGKEPEKALLEFVLGSSLSLAELEMTSRNEDHNTSGMIKWKLYSSGGLHDKKLLLAMKDLVRQCIIVGADVATHYGGYPSSFSRVAIIPPQRVYIVDLAALQFQIEYNTGRFILIEEHPKSTNEGLLDDFIFRHVVGEPKKSYKEAEAEHSDRFIRVQGFSRNETALFDTYAYKKFITLDVVLCGLAIAETAGMNGDQVNFKFLKYGTGFFAGMYEKETNNHILDGVIDGLEILLEKYGPEVLKTIRHVELPFYRGVQTSQLKRLETIKIKYEITYSITRDDALKPTWEGFLTATTNCGDSMAVIGNEMGFSSVDAAVTENLDSDGAIFCPILNPSMKERFFDL